MPGVTPLLLPTQAAAKQVSKLDAPQQVDAGEGDREPFSQALAKQLADVSQDNAASKGKAVSLPGADTPDAEASLPPHGDVLPPPLPSNAAGIALAQLSLAGSEAGTPENLLPADPLSPATVDVPVALPFVAATLPRPETSPVTNAAAGAASAAIQNEAAILPVVPPPVDAVLVPGARVAQQSAQSEGRLAGTVDAIALSTATSAAVTHDPRPQRAEVPIVMQLSVPLQDPGWDQAVAQRVLWMVQQGAQSAELRINPPGLGTVEVRVMLGNNDQARVSFTSAHAEVREALEAAFPRLREMLGANGLVLADANVSAHSFAEQRQASHYQGGAHPGSAAADPEQPDADVGTEAAVKVPVGLLDLYA